MCTCSSLNILSKVLTCRSISPFSNCITGRTWKTPCYTERGMAHAVAHKNPSEIFNLVSMMISYDFQFNLIGTFLSDQVPIKLKKVPIMQINN